MKKHKCTECDKPLRKHGNVTIGFCWESGASYDTVFGILNGWPVTAYRYDGEVLFGMVVDEGDEHLHLHDWSDADIEWSVTPMDDIVHININ